MRSPKTKAEKFLRYAILRNMWNKRQQRPRDDSSNLWQSSTQSCSSGSSSRQRTVEQVIEVHDDADERVQQRTAEQIVSVPTETAETDASDEHAGQIRARL